ncbi:ADP-ribosylglycohydrolase family protein [Rarobacter incanus]|uniref:ADP-ribosylglycohydrolase n=1 Tax=Rarobacter incanus TaxID=153494 RepID=A0A542SMJ5_9MICO|nr:ADP-ribosylglycohydrolase family protein [Rarobacter incanus]TQK75851.1 ADP-ribosylglycohydrolase [Rarobacter incanus]
MTLLSDHFRRDATVGSLMGLAIGDALGTTIEFASRDQVPEVTDLVGGGPFDLQPGQWTDDTSLALCIASSLAETGAYDPIDQLERFVAWRDHGFMSSTGVCFDIGYQTSHGLDEFLRTGNPYRNNDNDRSAGNGSLMRLAPVALAFTESPAHAARLAADSSRTTHPATECVDACFGFGWLIAVATLTRSKEAVFAAATEVATMIKSPTIAAILGGSFKDKSRDQISSSGYVVNTLEAALWALWVTESFEEGAVLVVNLADDSDTVGAVYGQLAGAIYGIEAIPKRWIERVYARELIEDLALAIYSRGGNFTVAQSAATVA